MTTTFTLPDDKTLESLLEEMTDAAGLKVAEFYGGDDAHPDLKDTMRRALKGVLRRNVRIADAHFLGTDLKDGGNS